MANQLDELACVRQFNVSRVRLEDDDEYTRGTGNDCSTSAGTPRSSYSGAARPIIIQQPQRSRSAGPRIHSNVDRGRVLNFTEEQERDRRRAERALHKPREGNQSLRTACTVPTRDPYWNALAQPKAVVEDPYTVTPATPPPPAHGSYTPKSQGGPYRTASATQRPQLSTTNAARLAPPPSHSAMPANPYGSSMGPTRTPVSTTYQQQRPPPPSFDPTFQKASMNSSSPTSLKQATALIHAPIPTTTTVLKKPSTSYVAVTSVKEMEEEARKNAKPPDQTAAWRTVQPSSNKGKSSSSVTTPASSTTPVKAGAASGSGSGAGYRKMSGALANTTQEKKKPKQKKPEPVVTTSSGLVAVSSDKVASIAFDPDEEAVVPDAPEKVLAKRNTNDEPMPWPPPAYTEGSSKAHARRSFSAPTAKPSRRVIVNRVLPDSDSDEDGAARRKKKRGKSTSGKGSASGKGRTVSFVE